MDEILVNLHMHTVYSDGTGRHEDLARAALDSGVDVIIVTDHNVLVQGIEGYRQDGLRRVLLLAGEEINDRLRKPIRNHLLVLGAGRELASLAQDPQRLIDQAQRADGLTFIAHPYDLPMPAFHEEGIQWEDWNVRGFTGLELWNGFSELKSVAKTYAEALFYAFFPHFIAHGPEPQTLKKWDELLNQGNKVVVIGGSDAHALRMHLGPLHRTIFPYRFHFRGINTHLLLPAPLTGELVVDRRSVLSALRGGNAFIGYDLPAPTHGFRFTAQGKDRTASMGEDITLYQSVTFQVRLPLRTECRLIKDGEIVKVWEDREICAYIAREPGVYRVECYIDYLGKQRAWIFSNPIYVRQVHPERVRRG
jgi:hypothetical protein